MVLEHYGGNGFGSCRKDGKYQVNWEDDKEKVFTDYDEAVKFYNELKCSKAFWDITRGAELIDCWA